MNDLAKRPAPALALGDSLMRMLSDPNISAEKMAVLLNMQKEIMAESRREAFQAAFAAMAHELPQVDRRGKVELIKDGKKFGSYNYAKWEDMDDIIRPVLFKFGFSLTFASRVDGPNMILTGKLMHAGGHSEVSERRLIADPGPGRNNLQAEGSGLSYAKRYLAEGLLNIVRKGEDTDAIGAGLQPISEAQVKQLAGLLGETGTKEETFLRLFVTGIEKLDQVPAREFPRLKNALDEKLKSLLKSKNKQGL
jgi:hypothetical protein